MKFSYISKITYDYNLLQKWKSGSFLGIDIIQYINKLRRKKIMTISDAKKAFGKIQQPFLIKAL